MGNHIESFTLDTYGITWAIEIYADDSAGFVGVLVSPVIGGQLMEEWTEIQWGVPYIERHIRYATRTAKLIDACMRKIKQHVPELQNMIDVVKRYPKT